MKIEGPGGVKPPTKAKEKGKASESSAAFGGLVASETKSSAPTQSMQSLTYLDALLAVQGSEDPTARAAKKRMRGRAETILQELDKIRMAMLGGTLTVGHMIDVADIVASHREKIMDPGLTAIMDEIDLRAQVELAKMRMALHESSEA